MNFVQKEFLNFALRLSFFLVLLVLYLLSQLMSVVKKKLVDEHILSHGFNYVTLRAGSSDVFEPHHNAVQIQHVNENCRSEVRIIDVPDEDYHVTLRTGSSDVFETHHNAVQIQHVNENCRSEVRVIDMPDEDNITENDIPDHTDNTDEGTNKMLPSFVITLKVAFVKLLKLNFTPITSFAFRMIHCVTILDNLHLYVYGDETCYSWWQLLIFTVLIPWILLFPASVELSLRLLKQEISSNHYLLMTAFPHYTIIFYVQRLYRNNAKQGCRSKQEDECVKQLLKSDAAMYRQGSRQVHWQVVLLLRSILVVIVNTFLINPVYRILFFIPVFGLLVIHDLLAMPFRCSRLNFLQVLSSLFLLLLSCCNVLSAVSVMHDIGDMPDIEIAVTILDVIEKMLILSIIPVWFVMWKVSSMVKKRRTKEKKD